MTHPLLLLGPGRMLYRRARLRQLNDCTQDFLKEVDLQFLDHMRRGTSINFADLASDPPPASMQVQTYLRVYAAHPVLSKEGDGLACMVLSCAMQPCAAITC